jgi:hypothetical protein
MGTELKMKQLIVAIVCLWSMTAGAEDISAESNDIQVMPENATEIEENTADSQDEYVEPEVVFEVFPADFMRSLLKCRQDKAVRDNGDTAEIFGLKDGYCEVSFLNFNMKIPQNILPNIHGFDDLTALLKNPDISTYNYKPEYVYDGLLFELDNCYRNKNAHIATQLENDNGVVIIRRGVSSEYISEHCFVKLQNELEINGSIRDYTVVCRMGLPELAELLSPYREIIAQYGAKRKIAPNGQVYFRGEQANEETQRADAELLYVLQRGGFCLKPHR